MATFKHISSKNADYGAAEQYLTFEHDEFTMKPTLDGNGRLVLRDDYRISSLNCGDEDFAIACMRSNLKYGKNQKREDVKSHHYIISFDPRDAQDNGLSVDRAQQLGEQFCKEHFPGHQALVFWHCGMVRSAKITEQDYLAFQNAQTVKDKIGTELRQSDTISLEYSYYIRKNGIMHIQCDVQDAVQYGYYTVRYEGTVLDEDLGEYNPGQMETSFLELEVVY